MSTQTAYADYTPKQIKFYLNTHGIREGTIGEYGTTFMSMSGVTFWLQNGTYDIWNDNPEPDITSFGSSPLTRRVPKLKIS